LDGDLAHVFATAPFHRPPQGPVKNLQQAMVLAEADESCERHVEHLAGGARPDRGGHRQQVPFRKCRRVASFMQEVTQAALVVGMRQQPGDAFPVETQDVGEHGPELRAHEVALLPEDGRQIAPRPLDVGVLQADRERHLGLDAVHAEHGEQRDQVRVGLLVEDEETGIDRVRLAFEMDVHCVGVAAEVVSRLEQRDFVLATEQPGTGETGDAGADDGDALLTHHASLSV
jgi:hypothetical protein